MMDFSLQYEETQTGHHGLLVPVFSIQILVVVKQPLSVFFFFFFVQQALQ